MRRSSPSRFLLEPAYWQARLDAMRGVHPGLIVFPRPDLSTPLADVVEWQFRAHDGLRLRGLKSVSRFGQPRSARVRFVDAARPLEVDPDALAEGACDLVFQVPVGRRLEDRVLDVLRVRAVVCQRLEMDPEDVTVAAGSTPVSDEVMIAGRLIESGLV